jgi:hypothetical protein
VHGKNRKSEESDWGRDCPNLIAAQMHCQERWVSIISADDRKNR